MPLVIKGKIYSSQRYETFFKMKAFFQLFLLFTRFYEQFAKHLDIFCCQIGVWVVSDGCFQSGFATEHEHSERSSVLSSSHIGVDAVAHHCQFVALVAIFVANAVEHMWIGLANHHIGLALARSLNRLAD